MALESTLTIKGRDDTGGAFAAVEGRIKKIDEQLSGVMKTVANVGGRDGIGILSESIERATRTIGLAAAASAGLRGELGKLTEAQAKLASFRGMQAGFDQARANFNAARGAVERLGAAMAATSAPTKKMTEEYARAQAAVTRAAATFEQQKSAMTTLKGEIENVIGPMRSLSSAESRLAEDVERVTSALTAQGVAAERAAERTAGAERAARAAERDRQYWQQRQQQGREGAPAGNRLGPAMWLAAPFAFHEFKAAVESGEEVEKARVALRAAHVPESEISAVDAQAAQLIAQYPNVKRSDILKRYQEGRSMMRDPAEMMQFLPDIVQAEAALNAYDPSGKLGDSLKYVMKGAEAQGLAQKPQEFRRNLNEAVKALQVLGSTVEPEQLFDFARNLKGEAPFLSDRFRYRTAPSLIQEMTGASAGKALSQYANDIIIGFSHRKDAAAMALKLGLVNRKDLLFDKTGNPRGLKPGRHIKDFELALSDPDKWLYQDVLPKLAGLDDAGRQAAIDTLFGHTTVSGLLNKLISQQQTIEAHGAQTDAALGLSATDVYKGDPAVALASLTTAITNLAAAATSPAMKDAATAMSGMAAWIGAVAAQVDAWQRQHPQAARVGSDVGLAGLAAGGIYAAWRMAKGVWGHFAGAVGDGVSAAADGGLRPYPGMPHVAPPGSGGLLGLAGRLFGPFAWALWLRDVGELMNPTTPAGAPYRVDAAWATQREDIERSMRAERELRQGADMEAHRAAALSGLHAPGEIELDPNSKVEVHISVEPSSDLLRVIANARASGNAAVGTSTAGIAPNDHGGIGRR